MDRDLRRLLLRIVLLALPVAILVICYLALDPFLVLRGHDRIYSPRYPVALNRDFACTDLYLGHPKRTMFDSFIFGSSRSLSFHGADWAPYIGDRAIFHFDASGESLYGVWSKMRFLHQDGRHFRNVLLIVDESLLKITANSRGHLFVKDPRVVHEGFLDFHLEFFTAFADPRFLAGYAVYLIDGKIHPWMVGIFEGRGLTHVAETNDLLMTSMDHDIATKGEAYFNELRSMRPPGEPLPAPGPPVIGEKQRALLEEMQAMIAADHADCRVVIIPLFDRVPMNAKDVAELRRIFGAQRVYNFSGANDLTNDIHNYYEPSHFRPTVARAVLKRIYGTPLRAAAAESSPIAAPLVQNGGRQQALGK